MKPIGIIFNDLHIKKDNREQVLSITSQLISKAKEIGVKNVIGLGDFFESRNEQPLYNLKTFEEILNLLQSNNLTLIAIPGNHDKVNYDSSESYLDAYAHHPALQLWNEPSFMEVGGVKFLLCPFFSDRVWIEKMTPHLDSKNTVLLSHIAVEGSVNNDGSTVSSKITPSLLKGFKMVLLGHYHNEHQVGRNIFHLHSTHQNNHGESEHKGFTVINDDLSLTHIQTEFKRFITKNINVDTLTNAQIAKEVKQAQEEQGGAQVRVNFLGSKGTVPQSLISEVKRAGMDVKVFHPDIETSIEEAESGNIVEFDSTSIVEEFGKFCAKNEFGDDEQGLFYLNKKLHGIGKD